MPSDTDTPPPSTQTRSPRPLRAEDGYDGLERLDRAELDE